MIQSPRSTGLTIVTMALALLLVRLGLQSYEDASRPRRAPAQEASPAVPPPTRASPRVEIASAPTPTPIPPDPLTIQEKHEILKRMAEDDYSRWAAQYPEVPDDQKVEIWNRYQATGP